MEILELFFCQGLLPFLATNITFHALFLPSFSGIVIYPPPFPTEDAPLVLLLLVM